MLNTYSHNANDTFGCVRILNKERLEIKFRAKGITLTMSTASLTVGLFVRWFVVQNVIDKTMTPFDGFAFSVVLP